MNSKAFPVTPAFSLPKTPMPQCPILENHLHHSTYYLLPTEIQGQLQSAGSFVPTQSNKNNRGSVGGNPIEPELVVTYLCVCYMGVMHEVMQLW